MQELASYHLLMCLNLSGGNGQCFQTCWQMFIKPNCFQTNCWCQNCILANSFVDLLSTWTIWRLETKVCSNTTVFGWQMETRKHPVPEISLLIYLFCIFIYAWQQWLRQGVMCMTVTKVHQSVFKSDDQLYNQPYKWDSSSYMWTLNKGHTDLWLSLRRSIGKPWVKLEKNCILHYLDLPDQLIVLILVYIWKLVYFNLVLLNLFHNLKRESDQLPTDLHTQN